MAIKKNITTEAGLTATDAYIRVIKIDISQKQNAVAELSFGVNEDAMPFQYKAVAFQFNLAGDNPWKQAYNYIKTLPEYQDAVDC